MAPLTLLLLLASAAAGVYGVAEPSCTSATCVFDDPSATPSITKYPTTLTFSSHMSATTSVYNFAVGAAASSSDDGGVTTDIQNMVTYEPHASSPTAFPATVVMTAVTTHTMLTGNPAATATVSLETGYSTWVVRPPAPTDLPRHGRGVCGNCTQPAAWSPAPQCVAQNQTTGCVRQCAQRDGMWYCFQKDDWYQENVMGRVCAWLNPFYGTTEYKMLGEPCVAGDRTVDCLACDLYG